MTSNYFLGDTRPDWNGSGVQIPELLEESENLSKMLYVDSGQTLVFLKPALYKYYNYATGRDDAVAIIGLSNTQTVYRYSTGTRFNMSLSQNINDAYYANFTEISGYTLPIVNPNFNYTGVSTNYQSPITLPMYTNSADLIAYCCGSSINYNWQAVPSIVGKSAVSLDLSVILDINNGEAVTTSDASKFNLNNDSNVITLVNNVINQNE